MAIDPLLSPATSRVVEFQRGSGDEKRRQDSAASYLARPQGLGGLSVAANEVSKRQDALSSVDARQAKSRQAQPVKGQGQEAAPAGERSGGRPAFLQDAAELAKNDRRLLFGSIAFAAQQLSQEAGDQETLTGSFESRNRNAFTAYDAAQGRTPGTASPSAPQLVTESGVLMGFGAIDNAARLDVTV
ncbi:MAG: hypothetical protein HQL45_16635 [Alphaproteobacteria bacterium]|nr:hypothetical protein [Alphaproteobacteria bacterium]